MGRPRKGLETSRDVKLYLSAVLARVEKDEMPLNKAQICTNIAYKIQMSIAGELKEKELEIAEALKEQLDKTQRGV